MADIELSVVIPSHNRRELLKELLLSLADQSLAPERFEVIVVVDGSQDGTMEMLRQLEVPYRLVALYQEQSGVAVARNRGAQAALGQVLVFLDDDVLPDRRLLEEHTASHLEVPGGVVLGRLVPAGTGQMGGWNVWEEHIFTRHYQRLSQGVRAPSGRRLYSGNFSCNRETFLRAGGFNEELRRGEDVELGFRLEHSGAPFRFNARASAVHRGFRTFRSWCNSAYLYGRTDVGLALDRGHPQVLAEIFGWYHRKPAAIRWAVRLCTDRPLLRASALAGVRALAGTLSWLRLYRLSHPGYSIIFALHYWQGVADQLGGRDAFMAQAARFGPHGAFPGKTGQMA